MDSVKILKAVAGAAKSGSRVLLIETVVPDSITAGPESYFPTMMDLHMLQLLEGAERTEKQYQHLFEQAGLKFKGVRRTPSPMAIIEAVKP